MAVIQFEKKKFYLDNKLKYNLDKATAHMQQNDDTIIVIVGPERAGKSTLRDQLAKYMSKVLKTKFDIKNIHFNYIEYMKTSLSGKWYEINSHDEARRDLNKLRQNSKSNVQFNNFLSEIGDKRGVHIILLPSFSDLDPYVAIHRSKILIKVHKYQDKKDPNKLVRGHATVYSTKNKKLLETAYYSKYQTFPKGMKLFDFEFKNVSLIDEKEYEEKKAKFREEKYTEKTKEEIKEQRYIKAFDNLIKLCKGKITRREIKENTGFSEGYITSRWTATK